jgi:hypothetical protein
MSTRSTTTICDEDGPVAEFYKHYDGYPEEWGRKLASFLDGFSVRNGLNGDTGKIANGAGCLAAQLVAAHKSKPGDLYLQPPGTDSHVAYRYTITATAQREISVKVEYCYGSKPILFDGPVSAMASWIDEYEKREISE